MEDLLAEIKAIFPRPLLAEEVTRAEALAQRALRLIELEFARRGRDLAQSLAVTPWLAAAVDEAIIRMVNQAVIIGDQVGRASASSATGTESDSVTWSQGIGIHWGMVGITPDILELLGLSTAAMPRGRGGMVVPFGERGPQHFGAEFAERSRG